MKPYKVGGEIGFAAIDAVFEAPGTIAEITLIEEAYAQRLSGRQFDFFSFQTTTPLSPRKGDLCE